MFHRATPTHAFFFCTLLACLEGRGRSPSVSEMGEKTDLPNFSTYIAKRHYNKLSNNANKLINAKVELLSKMENLAETVRFTWRRTRQLHGMSWGFRDTTDGECIGTGTQRNRRSDKWTILNHMRRQQWSPVRQSGQGVLPHACWLESASNLTNPGLGETGETYRRSHLRILSASSQ